MTAAPAPVAPRDPARRPHRETRRLVMRDGEEAPRALYEAHDVFNRLHFGGMLAAPLIFIAACNSPRALGDYCERDIHGLRSRIRIAPATWKRGWKRVLATLLHEMIHQWCAEVADNLEPGYKGHGPIFCHATFAISEFYGWPYCAPQGRKGHTRAEHWPAVQLDDDDHGPAKRPAKAARVDDDTDALAAGIALERARVRAHLAALAAQLRDAKRGRSASLIEQLALDLEPQATP